MSRLPFWGKKVQVLLQNAHQGSLEDRAYCGRDFIRLRERERAISWAKGQELIVHKISAAIFMLEDVVSFGFGRF